MIELLILFELYKKTLTMYGISREIRSDFAVLTLPSIGTIKPALDRLLKLSVIKCQKTMSAGGRPSVYYSLTHAGKDELKKRVLSDPVENPVQFLSVARVKIACSSVLYADEQVRLYKALKLKSENIILDTKDIQSSKEIDYYQRMVFENLVCEYKNFISLLDGLINTTK